MRRILSLIIIFFIAANGVSRADYMFYNGEDWENIKANGEESEAKELLIKAVQGASILSGAPILPLKTKELSVYTGILNDFYGKQENLRIPFCFALKIASMKKQNLPEKQIKVYKTAIIKKLDAI